MIIIVKKTKQYLHTKEHNNYVFILQIADLPPHLVLVSAGIIVTCTILRALLTTASAVRSNLNMKEKFFVGLAWMAKATVQVS